MKAFKALMILILFNITLLTAQIQKGQDIDGLTGRDQCGHELAISNIGNVLAVSSYFNNAAGYDAGMVRIFEWNGSNWGQRGSSLLGDSIDDAFGFALDMNANGTIVAVGIPYSSINRNLATLQTHGEVKIFEWNGSSWNLKGNSIMGVQTQEFFGIHISIDDLGNRIAVSSLGVNNNKGEVKVYDWNGVGWIQVGNTLTDEAIGDGFGTSISFSGSGSILAVGAPGNRGTTASTPIGHCRVFNLVGSVWTQIGADIDGEISGNSRGSGSAVELNDSGNVVIIGAGLNDGNGANAGHARVYKWNGTSWLQQGADIDGEAAGDFFAGEEVSINAEGNIIAVGAPYNTGNGIDAGHVRVFRWQNGAWQQKGIDIDGEGQFDESGTAVALDSLGVTVAIGAPENSNAINFSGHARVYDLSTTVNLTTVKNKRITTSISPNPFDREFIVSFKKPTKTQIKVRNAKGEIVYSDSLNNKSQYSVSLNTKSGLYFVEIGEGARKEVHKILKL